MRIIIRLQNLPWAANSVDIRRYFFGLSIPEGGVHIVGGEKGDAFIIFSTDEDARQAMERDGGKIKDMKVKLLLSSHVEMGRVIEQARNQTLSLQTPSAVKAAANDSDRRIRDRTPSPSRARKDPEKSPARDRRKAGYSKRDRSRSRSRSPSRRTDRDRDIDRRSDRGKRDDRSRYDERGDSRYKNSREYNTRDPSPQTHKNENNGTVQSEPNQKSFDPQMGATPQSFDSRHLDDSLRTGSMEFNPRQGNLPDSSSSFLDSRSQSASESAASSFTFPAALNMAHVKLDVKPESLPPAAFSGLDKFSPLFDSKQPAERRTSGNYETKRPSPTPAASAPKVESNLQYAKGYGMTSRADPYNSVNSNFGNCPDPTASTYGTVQTAEKGAVPAVPHDRKNVLPNKPVYGAEPHARYEQIPEANQASRSSTAPVSADDPRSFSKRSPSISSAIPATTMPSNVKPRRSRFEPEIPTPQGNLYSKAPSDPRSSSATYSPRSSDTTSHSRQTDNSNPSLRESNLGRKETSWLGQPSGTTAPQRPALLTPPQHPNEFPEGVPMDIDNPDDKNTTNMLPSNRGAGRPLRREMQNHDSRPQHSRGYFPSNPDRQKNSPFEERPPPRSREPQPLNESRRGPPLNQSEELPLQGRNGGPAKRGPPLTAIVKDLPYDVTENDVLTLFRGIFVGPENLKLQRNSHGLPSAYVKFVKIRDYDEALSRSRQKAIANTFPEILPCSVMEFENARGFSAPPRVENEGPSSQGLRRPDLRPREEDLCVEIEGLPASCTEDDLIQFFDGLGILDIVIKENPDNRGTVLGYVEFGTPADFHAAIDSTGKMIGRGYITVIISSKEIMTVAQKNKRVRKGPLFPQPLPRESAPPTQRGLNKNPRPIPQDGLMYCVAINGLPEFVKNRDIADFFAEDKIVPRAIHIMLDSKKLPSGEAFSEFIGIHEFEIALQRNGKFLGDSRVSVSQISYQEMTDILKGSSSAPLLRNPPEDRPTRRPLMPMPPPREEDVAFRERRPLDDMPPDNFGPNRHRLDARYAQERSHDHPGSMGTRPPFGRMRPPASSRPNNRPQRPPLFGSDGPPPRFGSDGPPRFGSDGPPRFGSDGPPRFGSDGTPPRFGSDGPPPRFRPNGPQRGPLLAQNDGPQDFGMPGCVVSINNLHFRAGLDEIMEAFQGFPLDKDKIIRKYNDKGQATGEARIAFQCREDATRAVEEVNQKIIFGRPIYLSLV